MTNTGKFFQVVVLTVLSCAAFNPAARAILTPIEGIGDLGSYTGTIEYTFANATTAQFKVFLTNTSPVDNGGYLTAFVFNNPSNLISGATFDAGGTNFALLPSTFTNDINGAPYGQFDVGASTGNGFEGSGNPALGLGVGSSGNFTFDFTGSNLDTLSEQSFLDAASVGPGDGEGNRSFVARFRGFEDGGSDKVPAGGGEPVVPEPMTMILFGAGAAAAFLNKRKIV